MHKPNNLSKTPTHKDRLYHEQTDPKQAAYVAKFRNWRKANGLPTQKMETNR